MKTGRLCFILLVILLLFNIAFSASTSTSVSAQAAEQKVVVIHFKMSVDPGSQQLFQDGLATARSVSASAIAIDMNTPGGLLLNAENIIGIIQQAQSEGIKVYTFVEPSGWAASAGSYIAMATDGIYMGPGSIIGPSTPIVVGGTALEQQHVENATLATMKSLAQSHNRNVTAAAVMVTNNVAYTAEEAVRYGLANGFANSLQQMLAQVGLADAQLIDVYPSVYAQFLSFLSNATVDGFLILLGSIAILLDLYHASLVLTIAGVILLALGFLGAQLIGAPVVAFVVLASSAVLIILEVKTGHGFSMLAGITLAIFGIWLLGGSLHGYSPSPFGPLQYASWGIVAAVSFLGSLYLIKLREGVMKREKAVSVERVVGKEGYVTSDVNPPMYGTANIASEDWTITCDTPLKAGERVRAVKVEGAIVKVEKVED
ncbi:MAG: nodulation protein NfeD [Conexivisphaerales archaeon]